MLLFSDFSILAILVGVKCYLVGVSICISPMANEVEHLLMCLLATWASSLEKRLFGSLCSFSNWVTYVLIVEPLKHHFIRVLRGRSRVSCCEASGGEWRLLPALPAAGITETAAAHVCQGTLFPGDGVRCDRRTCPVALQPFA